MEKKFRIEVYHMYDRTQQVADTKVVNRKNIAKAINEFINNKLFIKKIVML